MEDDYENLLLAARTARLRKRVVRISNPSAGEIAPVVRIAASWHPDLVAVVNLRNAPQRQGESERQLQLCRRAAFGAREARHVMIREERNEHLGSRI